MTILECLCCPLFHLWLLMFTVPSSQDALLISVLPGDLSIGESIVTDKDRGFVDRNTIYRNFLLRSTIYNISCSHRVELKQRAQRHFSGHLVSLPVQMWCMLFLNHPCKMLI